MYSEKTKFYTHPELGIQTVALKDGQVYFIPKDFTGRFGYKCNDALLQRAADAHGACGAGYQKDA